MISPDRVRLQEPSQPWQSLVRESAHLLEQAGITSAAYTDAIFDSIEHNGDYMVVAPGVLLAHARPEHGALGTGLSLITVREPVAFNDNPSKPVQLFFTLAADDAETHVGLLSTLAAVLVDDALSTELMSSSDVDRVISILQSGS